MNTTNPASNHAPAPLRKSPLPLPPQQSYHPTQRCHHSPTKNLRPNSPPSPQTRNMLLNPSFPPLPRHKQTHKWKYMLSCNWTSCSCLHTLNLLNLTPHILHLSLANLSPHIAETSTVGTMWGLPHYTYNQMKSEWLGVFKDQHQIYIK